jgi:predicted amidophosphoribosyltransferase
MTELQRLLNLSLPIIKITKIKTPIIVPQKTLSKLEERVKNAYNSIVVEEQNVYNNILLIDDAVGSGATINETAKQINQKSLCRNNLIGLGVTGSYSGFDIIHEA